MIWPRCKAVRYWKCTKARTKSGARRDLVSQAGMAELADAADSKSAEVHPSWGFNSPSRHHLNTVYFLDCPAADVGAAGADSGVLLGSALFACAGVADTTSYSRSLLSASGTLSTM